MTYGILRTILLTEYRLGRKAVNLQIALADERIREAIKTAYNVAEPLVSIRKRAKRIVSDARGIKNDADDADHRLRDCLEELQKRIDFAMDAIPQNQIAQQLQILTSSG
jgi:DNA-binding ferritin-like protein